MKISCTTLARSCLKSKSNHSSHKNNHPPQSAGYDFSYPRGVCFFDLFDLLLPGTIFRTRMRELSFPNKILYQLFFRVRFFVPVRVEGYGVIVGTSSGGYEFSYPCWKRTLSMLHYSTFSALQYAGMIFRTRMCKDKQQGKCVRWQKYDIKSDLENMRGRLKKSKRLCNITIVL